MSSVHAGLTTEVSAEAELTYSDNLNLATDGDELSGSVLSISPGFSAEYQSSKTTLTADYVLNYQTFSEDVEGDGGKFVGNNRAFHRGSLEAGIDLVPEKLKFTAGADVREKVKGFFADTIQTSTQNTSDQVVSGEVGLEHNAQFGRFAGLETAITAGVVEYEDDEVSDAELYGFSTGLSSGPLFDRTIWELGYEQKTEVLDTGDETTLGEVAAGITIGLTNSTALYGVGGYELVDIDAEVVDENDEQIDLDEELTGGTWLVGFNWQPNPRFLASVGYGERPFGKVKTGSINWTKKRSSFKASYNEDLTTRAIQDEINGFGSVDDEGGAGSQDKFVFISRALALGYQWKSRRTALDLGVRVGTEELIATDLKLRDSSLTMGVSRTLGRLSEIALIGTWRKIDNFNETQDIWRESASAALEFSQELGRTLSWGATAKTTASNSSEAALPDYIVNEYALSIKGTF